MNKEEMEIYCITFSIEAILLLQYYFFHIDTQHLKHLRIDFNYLFGINRTK